MRNIFNKLYYYYYYALERGPPTATAPAASPPLAWFESCKICDTSITQDFDRHPFKLQLVCPSCTNAGHLGGFEQQQPASTATTTIVGRASFSVRPRASLAPQNTWAPYAECVNPECDWLVQQQQQNPKERVDDGILCRYCVAGGVKKVEVKVEEETEEEWTDDDEDEDEDEDEDDTKTLVWRAPLKGTNKDSKQDSSDYTYTTMRCIGSCHRIMRCALLEGQELNWNPEHPSPTFICPDCYNKGNFKLSNKKKNNITLNAAGTKIKAKDVLLVSAFTYKRCTGCCGDIFQYHKKAEDKDWSIYDPFPKFICKGCQWKGKKKKDDRKEEDDDDDEEEEEEGVRMQLMKLLGNSNN